MYSHHILIKIAVNDNIKLTFLLLNYYFFSTVKNHMIILSVFSNKLPLEMHFKIFVGNYCITFKRVLLWAFQCWHYSCGFFPTRWQAAGPERHQAGPNGCHRRQDGQVRRCSSVDSCRRCSGEPNCFQPLITGYLSGPSDAAAAVPQSVGRPEVCADVRPRI